MKKNLSIKIFLNDKRSKGDRKQIAVRIIHDRKKAEWVTPHFIEEKDWDPAKERCKKNHAINIQLAELESGILNTQQHLEFEKKTVSAKAIKDVFLGKDTVDTFLLKKYSKYIDDLISSSNKSLGTRKAYKQTYHLITKFLEALRKKDINVMEINLDFLESWDRFLNSYTSKTGESLKTNTITKHHSRFRTFLLYLHRHQLINQNPYNHFKLKYEESDRTFLTREELEKFENCNLKGNKSLERVRDVFVFSVYTGMRFGDAQKLQSKDLMASNGRLYFSHKEQKTKKHNQIPILPKAEAIIVKYEDTPERSFGKVLPKISNQKCNIYLKVIAEIAGITEKEVTHHVSRHTCATTVLLENGVPLEIVQAWLNHSNIRETMIYAKLTNRVVNESASVEGLFEKFGVRPSTAV